MTNETGTSWFVEPLDGNTNEHAMEDLMHAADATEENIHHRKKDDLGIEHDVIEVKRWFIIRMENNATKYDHMYRVYTQTYGGKMRLWPFGRQSNLRRTAEVKRVAKKIAKLPKR